MDRRVAIIRFWLLCFAAMAVAVCWPQVGVGLWPVLFFFPSCVCCGTPCAGCTGTQPGSIQAVVTGIVNGTCADCDNYNGTWVLSADIEMCVGGGAGGFLCLWTYSEPTLKICTSESFCFTAAMGSFNGFFNVYDSEFRATAEATPLPRLDVVFKHSYGSAQNCAAWSSESWGFDSDTASCDGSAGNCEITAL